MDQPAAWNLDNSKCVIEVPTGFAVTSYIQKFRESSDFKSWRNSDANWPDWETQAQRDGDLD